VSWNPAGLNCRPLPRWTVLPGDPAPLRRELARRAAAEPPPAPALRLAAAGGVRVERVVSCRACGTALDRDGGCFTCAETDAEQRAAYAALGEPPFEEDQ